MSELDSVYAKIKISEENLKKYLVAPISPLKRFNEWYSWTLKQSYYGNISKIELIKLDFHNIKTHKEFLDVYINEDSAFGELVYDKEKEELVISILLFSENILDILRMLHVISSISSFKEKDSVDFVIIYGFMWDLEANNYLEIKKGSSSIKYEIPKKVLNEANEHLSIRRYLASKLYKD